MPAHQLQIIAVQSYGYIDGPNDFSSGAEGSRARLNKGLAIAQFLSRSNDVLFLFPQGYGKGNASTPREQILSLGESMARYVTSMLPSGQQKIRVCAKPLSWGTANDLLAIFQIADELRIDSIPHVHLVTDPSHLKRVRLIWRYINELNDWPTTFHAATKHRMTLKERLIREPIARLLYRYQLLRGR